MEFMQAFPQFKPCVESMQFPGEPAPNNLLMYKGTISAGQPKQNYSIKVILVSGFPFRPPKAFVDQ
jgi:hypothetical protein